MVLAAAAVERAMKIRGTEMRACPDRSTLPDGLPGHLTHGEHLDDEHRLLDALAEILADALLADLEADLESEELPSVRHPTAQSPTGFGSQSATSADGGSAVGDVATAA